jgi:6-phosphogluconolactonase
MKHVKLSLVVCLVTAAAVFALPPRTAAEDNPGAVFVMNNAASGNKVLAFARLEDGSLIPEGAFATGGNGSGGTIDPLQSQGSLTLSSHHRLLFAVNADSNSVSSFRVDGAHLTLVDTAPSGGAFPKAIAQAGDLVYVLNGGADNNVSGFRVAGNGRLIRIPHSTRDLSAAASTPTSLTFSPNGRFLVVTENATNKIDVFRVEPNGALSDAVVNASAGAAPFAAVFAPNGTLIVANASDSISSYILQYNQTLVTVSNALPTLGQATCWDVITPDGNIVYAVNAATSNISGFTIGRDGSLAAIDSTIVSTSPSGSTDLDTGISEDGRYVYTLYAGTGAIGRFAVGRDGTLISLGQQDGLPASAGLNGLAAY